MLQLCQQLVFGGTAVVQIDSQPGKMWIPTIIHVDSNNNPCGFEQ